jgi:hypothetical protein
LRSRWTTATVAQRRRQREQLDLIKDVGVKSNRSGIGARVTVVSGI